MPSWATASERASYNVVLPPARAGAEATYEAMPIAQSLRVFVPGQVTRRFASERNLIRSTSHQRPVSISRLLRRVDHQHDGAR